MLAFGISPAMVCFNSYMCGECFARRRCPGCRWSCFNSYMCGECFSVGSVVVSTHICAGNVSFRIRYRTMEHALVSTHICAGECSNTGRGHWPMGISFNSYMCGEYFWRLVDVISNVKCVSTHICAGNVSKQELAFDRNLKVSTHICAGNVSALAFSVRCNR